MSTRDIGQIVLVPIAFGALALADWIDGPDYVTQFCINMDQAQQIEYAPCMTALAMDTHPESPFYGYHQSVQRAYWHWLSTMPTEN